MGGRRGHPYEPPDGLYYSGGRTLPPYAHPAHTGVGDLQQ